MPSVKFHLYETHKNKEGLPYIYMVFHFSGNILRMSCNEKIAPGLWDKQLMRIKPRKGSPHIARINRYLDRMESVTKQKYWDMMSEGTLSVQGLKEQILLELKQSGQPDKDTFFTYTKNYIDQLEQSGKKPRNIRTMKTLLEKFRPDMDFADINMNFYNGLVGWMTLKGYSKNTIGSVISAIKRVMNAAVDDEVTDNIKFRNRRFKRMEEVVYYPYNTVEELEQLHGYDFSDKPHLGETRDRYLISAFTGLRFQDNRDLKKANFTEDGFVVQDTAKVAGERVIIPLHRIVKEILERREHELPKPIHNAVMNRQLKDVGRLAGIDAEVLQTRTQGGQKVTTSKKKWQMMSTHMARRSMATNMYLAGIPIEAISALLGHSNTRQTYDYIKITKQQLAESLKTHPFFN